MKNYTPYKKIKADLLNDPKVKTEYDALQPLYAFITSLIKKRTKLGLSQEQLAIKAGTHQSAIARFESGTYNPSIKFLQRIARATNSTLHISLK